MSYEVVDQYLTELLTAATPAGKVGETGQLPVGEILSALPELRQGELYELPELRQGEAGASR